jgi:hypothetical protein
MTTAGRNWTALASSLFALAITTGYPAAQAPSITVAPSNPTLLVGQSQQFTATGVSAPAMIAGGGYHTCMLMSDQSVRCFGENNWGQLGNGGFANSSNAGRRKRRDDGDQPPARHRTLVCLAG